MSVTPLRVLLVEDDAREAELIAQELATAGFAAEITRVEDAPGLSRALAGEPDLVLSDWTLRELDALRALTLVQEHRRDVPFIIVSSSSGEEVVVRAIKHGATDFLVRDRLGRLGSAIRQALAGKELRSAERRARDELRDSERRFRAVVEQASDGILLHGTDAVVVDANRRACESLGYTREELIGLNVSVFDPMVTPSFVAQIRDTLVGGSTMTLESWHRRKDGSTFPVEVRLGLLQMEPRRLVMSMIRDISDRKRAEETRARLAAIVESAEDAIISETLDGAITSWNPGAERLLGYAASEVLGRSVTFTAIPSERQDGPVLAGGPGVSGVPGASGSSSGSSSQSWAQETGERVETVRRHKNGQLVHVSIIRTPLRNERGEMIGACTIMRDMTDRRRLEEQFRQAQKMEAVGRLAGGVAHDFNNLLTVINSYSEILLLDCPPESSRWADLNAIREAGAKAASLTAQLLAFSRKALVETRDINLNEVIGHAEKLLRRLIGEDVALDTELGAHLPFVRADPNRIDQIIMNLAVNARDAMPTGGRITLATREVRLLRAEDTANGPAPPGLYAELAVRDSGCGMSEEVRARIFEPFFTTKPVGQGTGLGLAVVHGVVEQAGGFISVETAEGRGTTFRILFPAVPPPRLEATKTASESPRRGNETILLVEDEAEVRRIGEIALEGQGYLVLSAGSGKEALEMARAHAGGIDLLVTDVVMPEMSGRVLATALRPLYPALRVLYVSGYTDDDVLRHGIAQSSDVFLQKPFTPLALARKVGEVLGSG